MEIQGVGSGITEKVMNSKVAEETMGKDAFLRLLVTQLEHQDPLNPMDNGEFVAQLAQFSSLEGITNLGKTMNGMAQSISSMQNLSASGLIGRYVKTEGNALEFTGTPAAFSYSLAQDAASVEVGVYDRYGRLVRTMDMGPKATGSHDAAWNGIDNTGAMSAPGLYSFNVKAKDPKGAALGAVPYTIGQVSSVGFDSGAAELTVGGSPVAMDRIKSIY